jgi:hypothetical protein
MRPGGAGGSRVRGELPTLGRTRRWKAVAPALGSHLARFALLSVGLRKGASGRHPQTGARPHRTPLQPPSTRDRPPSCHRRTSKKPSRNRTGKTIDSGSAGIRGTAGQIRMRRSLPSGRSPHAPRLPLSRRTPKSQTIVAGKFAQSECRSLPVFCSIWPLQPRRFGPCLHSLPSLDDCDPDRWCRTRTNNGGINTVSRPPFDRTLSLNLPPARRSVLGRLPW